MSTRDNNPTMGRVYGGDTGLIHIEDGHRVETGKWLAATLDNDMRFNAMTRGDRTLNQGRVQDLCPGCYMVAILNAAVALAQNNGQSLTELGNTMAAAFAKLAETGITGLESISVMLDPPEEPAAQGETLEARQARYDWWDAAALVAARYGMGSYPA